MARTDTNLPSPLYFMRLCTNVAPAKLATSHPVEQYIPLWTTIYTECLRTVLALMRCLDPVTAVVEATLNVMTHAQKPDFVFQRNRRVHLNQWGRQFSRLLAAEVCGISGSNAGYTMFRGSVKSTGDPLHSPVSPSLPLPCVTVCHHISTGVHLSHPSHLASRPHREWDVMRVPITKSGPQEKCWLRFKSNGILCLLTGK